MFCDLHMHSTASDGTDTPDALPALAQQAGLAAIALTDHDTTVGLVACAQACEQVGIAFVPGIELSADPGATVTTAVGTQRTGTLHILGLFVRHDHPRLLAIHHRILKARAERNPQIIENLNALGVRITYDDVLALAKQLGSEVVGRPHIAQVLVSKGYAKSVQDAFTKYIREGAPAYVRRDTLAPELAIQAIHDAGGLALLAHPVQLRYPSMDELEHFIRKLIAMGLDGIETRHSDHTPAIVDQLTRMAQRLDLLTTGGSDYHGRNKSIALASQRVALEVYHHLRDAHAGRRPAAV